MSDFWISLSFVVLYAAQCADTVSSWWGISTGRMREANILTRWFLVNPYRTFLLAGINLFLVVMAATAFKHLGWTAPKFSLIPFAAASISIYNATRNIIMIRRTPAPSGK